MKSTNNPQINTRTYWNYIYNTDAKNKEYWERTQRFFTANEYVKKGDKVIDIGCGVGSFCEMAFEKGAEVWGTDISSDVIEADKKRNPKIKYSQGYAGYNDELPGDYFDLVFAGEILEHLDEPKKLLEEGYRILKKKGKMIITTPVEDHVHSPEHVWEFNKDDIENLYFGAGFKKVEFVKLPALEHGYVFFAVGTK